MRTTFFQVYDSSILRTGDWLIDTFDDSSSGQQAFNSNLMAKLGNRHFTEFGWGRRNTLAQKRYPLVAECQENLDIRSDGADKRHGSMINLHSQK